MQSFSITANVAWIPVLKSEEIVKEKRKKTFEILNTVKSRVT
jgi:hypothetical protein